uniref:NIDO domain-containing protein n=1 Tax=Leptobrachium leishanense TaxID=445787 RepID=A0A8C5R3R2_9ANUR
LISRAGSELLPLSDTALFYPYGPAFDTTSAKSDDGSSPPIILATNIWLFGVIRTYLYVNHNGLLSFSYSISQYVPSDLPVGSGNPFLAPLWTDVDNRLAGSIYYRQSTDPELLARATADIRSYFCYPEFSAHWVFVATWDKVPYYGQSPDKVNTFQAVLITDTSMTFVLFNYGIFQWAFSALVRMGGGRRQYQLVEPVHLFFYILDSIHTYWMFLIRRMAKSAAVTIPAVIGSGVTRVAVTYGVNSRVSLIFFNYSYS